MCSSCGHRAVRNHKKTSIIETCPNFLGGEESRPQVRNRKIKSYDLNYPPMLLNLDCSDIIISGLLLNDGSTAPNELFAKRHRKVVYELAQLYSNCS